MQAARGNSGLSLAVAAPAPNPTLRDSPAAAVAHGADLLSSQMLAVPAYFRPGGDWGRMQHASAAVGLAVLNPGSGPGAGPEAVYTEAVRASQRAGLRILGYVRTAFGNQTISPLGQITADIDAHFMWYGVDGIFFDEVSTDVSLHPYYAGLRAHVRERRPHAITVINPGCMPSESYMSVADIVVTFENTHTAYTQELLELPDWTRRYPQKRFWHLVYGAVTAADMSHAVVLSRRRRAGWVYVTPCGTDIDVDGSFSPHPWCRLPSEAYWAAELAAVGAGESTAG